MHLVMDLGLNGERKIRMSESGSRIVYHVYRRRDGQSRQDIHCWRNAGICDATPSVASLS